MKRRFSALLFLLVAGGMIFAGGKPQGGSGSGTINLEFMHAQSTEPGRSIFQDAVNRFMADNPSVKVNVDMLANDSYKQKLAVAMASGKLPDIYFSWSGGPMYEYAKSGNIIDLTSYMNADNYKDKFLDAAIAQATWNGKIRMFRCVPCFITRIFSPSTI